MGRPAWFTGILVALVVTPSVVGYSDGALDWFVDPAEPNAGVSAFGIADIRAVAFEPGPSSVQVSIQADSRTDLPQDRWDVTYTMSFSGTWLEYGRATVEIRGGHLLRANLMVFENGGGTGFGIPATFDTSTRRLSFEIPNEALGGAMEHPYVRAEWTPCLVNTCTGGSGPGVVDRAPDSGYYPDVSPSTE